MRQLGLRWMCVLSKKRLLNSKERIMNKAFVGTWKLMDYSFLQEDGSVQKPWGSDVVGYLIYSAEGYMSGNLSPVGRTRSHHAAKDTAAKRPRRFRDYIAYAGAFTVNSAEQVTHHVEVSLFPNWIGLPQVRYCKMKGDELVLSTPPIPSAEGPVVVRLTWKRARS
jgi:hypothetical protein